MSKAAFICLRDTEFTFPSAEDLIALATHLAPDNAPALRPQIIRAPGLLCAILSPNRVVATHGVSVCLGNMAAGTAAWWQPGGGVPDGSYALFRSDEGSVEVLTDAFASRTVWYYHDKERFIAATSQRAIIALLGSFVANTAVYPWMLSSGTLGPGLSWDRRLTPLPPNSVLRLNRKAWRMRVSRTPLQFQPVSGSAAEQERRLESALAATFADQRFEPDAWMLPLSGGYDSRAIALFLKRVHEVHAVTWGDRSVARDPKGDAAIAKRLAAALGCRHEFLEITPWPMPVERVLRRFLLAGEGRVDHISGYVDGLELWRELGARCAGVIRGDEAFGARWAPDPAAVLHNMKLTTLDAFANLAGYSRHFDLRQTIPPALRRYGDESLAAWRDRIYMQFEIPVVFAALNDLKLWYVEVASPLLSRRIQQVVCRLPDPLRTDKTAFRRLVRRIGPPLGFARRRAVLTKAAAVRHPQVSRVIRERLSLPELKELLPLEVARGIAAAFGQRRRGSPLARRFLAKFGGRVRSVDPAVLGLRVLIVLEMASILAADAKALKSVKGIDDGWMQSVGG